MLITKVQIYKISYAYAHYLATKIVAMVTVYAQSMILLEAIKPHLLYSMHMLYMTNEIMSMQQIKNMHSWQHACI